MVYLSPALTRCSFNTQKPSFSRPLLFEANGKTIMNFSRRSFVGTPAYPRNPSIERVSEAQVEALDLIEEVASKVGLTFRFETGDIQYINNLGLLHARESFVNSDLDGCRRHLLRVFLKDISMAWEVPEELKDAMDALYEHNLEDEHFPWTFDPLPYVLSP